MSSLSHRLNTLKSQLGSNPDIAPHPFPPDTDEQGRTLAIRNDGSYYYRKAARTPRDMPEDKKYCPDCEEIKNITLFTSKTGKLYVYCQYCRNKKSRASYTVEKGQELNLRRMYGLSKEEYQTMLAGQGGVCACCGEPEKVINGHTGKVQRLSVDHHHDTGKVRKLLCNTCNNLVGYVEADIYRVQKAVDYVKQHQEHIKMSEREPFLS
jgi:Recombination endonuclease VII